MSELEDIKLRISALEDAIKDIKLLDANLERLNVMFDKLAKSTFFYDEETRENG